MSKQKQAVLAALDLLAFALTDHKHQWSAAERKAYEKAVAVLKR